MVYEHEHHGVVQTQALGVQVWLIAVSQWLHCTCSADRYKALFETELCRPGCSSRNCSLPHPLDWKEPWGLLDILSLPWLHPLLLGLVIRQAIVFLVCSRDIPALWASLAFSSLDLGSDASCCAGLQPDRSQPYVQVPCYFFVLTSLVLSWKLAAKWRKEGRGISILYASVPLPSSLLQVRLKPQDLMKQRRTATLLT